MAVAHEMLGEVWAVAGAVGPVDVRVYVRGVTAFHYGLSTEPQRILAVGVPLTQMVVQNLGLVPIELGNDRSLRYGEGIRIPPNSIYANGAVNPGGVGFSSLERFAKAALPTVGNPGRLVELTDYDRGLWIDDGANFWSIAAETFNVKAFGAKGDGATDDGPAFNLAITAAKVTGGRVIVPPAPSFYSIATLLNFDNTWGVSLEGTTYSTQPGLEPELRWAGGAGSGPMIRLNSSFTLKFFGLRLTYASAAYDGDLIYAEGATRDISQIIFEQLNIQGAGAAVGARSGIRLNRAHTIDIRNCYFTAVQDGLRIGDGNYAHAVRISKCFWIYCTDVPIRASGLNQGLSVKDCTFEPRADGASGALWQADVTVGITGLTYQGNWHGDVGANGHSWVEVAAIGATFSGNVMFNPGAGATDACIVLRDYSRGISVTGNYFERIPVDFRDASVKRGIIVAGNVFANGVVTGVANVESSTYYEYANHDGGTGASTISGTLGGLSVLATGVRLAAGGSAWLTGTGVPGAGLGANGDYYARFDGGAGAHIYFKAGGVWAAIA